MMILNLRKTMRKRARKARGITEAKELEKFMQGEEGRRATGSEDGQPEGTSPASTLQRNKSKQDVANFSERFGYVVNPLSAEKDTDRAAEQAAAWKNNVEKGRKRGKSEVELADATDEWDQSRKMRMQQVLRPSIADNVDRFAEDEAAGDATVQLTSNPMMFKGSSSANLLGKNTAVAAPLAAVFNSVPNEAKLTKQASSPRSQMNSNGPELVKQPKVDSPTNSNKSIADTSSNGVAKFQPKPPSSPANLTKQLSLNSSAIANQSSMNSASTVPPAVTKQPSVKFIPTPPPPPAKKQKSEVNLAGR
jgi:hypothetical protein